MQNYIIATDSASDLTLQQAEQYQIKIIPMSFIVHDKTYLQTPLTDYDFFRDFYNKMRAGEKVCTSQITPKQFTSFFGNFLKQNYDILYISLSSRLSGTYNSAIIAADSLKRLYPDRKIEIVDSLSASVGEALLVIKAATKKFSGTSLIALKHYIESIKLKINHIFTVDSLEYLKKSGRISSTTAFFGGMMGIKPLVYLDNNGKLINFEKVRGRKNSLDKLLFYTAQKVRKIDKQKVFIVHADCKNDAIYLESSLKLKLGIKNISINFFGPTICAHTGPETIGIVYLADNRNLSN